MSGIPFSTLLYDLACLVCARVTTAQRADAVPISRKSSEYDLERMRVDSTAASFTSFNSEEGFGSPAPRRNRDRPTVFDMDDNDLKVTVTTLPVCCRWESAVAGSLLLLGVCC